MKSSQRKGLAEIRAALTGPIASIRLPFARDGGIDEAGLREYVERSITHGTHTLLLTYGDSLFSLLSDQEIADVTRIVADQGRGRALVVAADGQWWTGQTVAFAQYAVSVGADVLMVLPPDWGVSCTPQTFADHYAAVSQHIPVMTVTNVFARNPGRGLDTLRLVRDTVPGVVAVKDDITGDFARKLSLLVHEHWAVFAGGQKQNHLNMLPYGCDGYLSSLIVCAPDITQRYWHAIRANDLAAAGAIIRDYDMPYFNFIGSLAGGFDAGMRGVLELTGIAGRWRRPPYHSLSDADLERLGDFLKSHGLLTAAR